jgi:hypothetical protein
LGGDAARIRGIFRVDARGGGKVEMGKRFPGNAFLKEEEKNNFGCRVSSSEFLKIRVWGPGFGTSHQVEMLL